MASVDDLARLALGVALGGLAHLRHAPRRLGARLALDAGHELGARLVGAHARRRARAARSALDQGVELAAALLRPPPRAQPSSCSVRLRSRSFFSISSTAPVEGGFLLLEGALGGELGVARLLVLALELLAEPERLLLPSTTAVRSSGLGFLPGRCPSSDWAWRSASSRRRDRQPRAHATIPPQTQRRHRSRCRRSSNAIFIYRFPVRPRPAAARERAGTGRGTGGEKSPPKCRVHCRS